MRRQQPRRSILVGLVAGCLVWPALAHPSAGERADRASRSSRTTHPARPEAPPATSPAQRGVRPPASPPPSAPVTRTERSSQPDKSAPPATKADANGRSSIASRASARRQRLAQLAREKAARQAREYREVATPLFRLDEAGNVVPEVRAAAAVIYNPVTGEVLFEENGDTARSIASITKVMTAVVVLEHEFDLGRDVVVTREDVLGARNYFVRAGERLSVSDLLHLMLIASDNAAARALARTSPFGYDGFVERMTAKAQELGLASTRYADPSGLDPENVSSALDMARLIAFAAGDSRLASIMRKNEHRVVTSRRAFTIHSTNRLLASDMDVQAGKTGFIRAAGYCLASLLRLPQGDPVAVVVLGARSNTARFMETRHLFNWVAARTQLMLGLPPTSPSAPRRLDEVLDRP